MTPPTDIIGIVKELVGLEKKVIPAPWHDALSAEPTAHDKEFFFLLRNHFSSIAQALLAAVDALEQESSLCIPYMTDGDEVRHRRILEALSRIKAP